MVVGGLPERNTIHAECVANQALDMMHYCKMVDRPDKKVEQPDEGESITVSVKHYTLPLHIILRGKTYIGFPLI